MPEGKKVSPSKRRRFRPAPVTVDQYASLRGVTLDELNETSSLPIKSEDNAEIKLPSYVKHVGLLLVCEICHAKCTSVGSLMQHLKGKRHFVMLLAGAMKKNRSVLKADKDGITVTVKHTDGLTINDTDDIVLSIDSKNSMRNGKNVLTLVLKNGTEHKVTLQKCGLLQYVFRDVFTLSGGQTVEIPSGGQIEVEVKTRLHFIGSYSTNVAFYLTRTSDPEYKIHIVRKVTVRYGDSDMAGLGPIAPFTHPPRITYRDHSDLIEDGIRPDLQNSSDRLECKLKLDYYDISTDLREVLNHGLNKPQPSDKLSKLAKQYNATLGATLDAKNYQEKFNLMLHIEEQQMEVDIRRYDILGAVLQPYLQNKKLLMLRVPGLSENRPSVLKGDQILVRKLNSDGQPEKIEYRGYVHEVLLNEVCLGFSAGFRAKWLASMKFNVRFVVNRLCERVQHRAVNLAHENSLYPVLFPVRECVSQRKPLQPLDTDIKFYNRLIEGNKEQALAVKHILAGSSRPAPFLIFGPPGTGKTVTVVEAMKQVVKCFPSSHILACCPSNNSADYLTQCLLQHVPRKSVLRLNAASRYSSTVPKDMLDVCNYDKTGLVEFPSTQEISRYSIVVCTLITAGRLVSANFAQGHFSHVFIDEAGQASEPECIIPIAGIIESELLVKDGGQVVLAGDPEQLGPVLRSPYSLAHGLGTSLLERFMKHVDVYKRRTQWSETPYNDSLLVKLVRNYRSHPDILRVPNEMFYDTELEVHANQLLRESLCRWEGLPKAGFPLIFHGVVGKEEREERSPSYFNVDEINVIRDYMERLTQTSKGMKVEVKDIGLITPYRKQVEKLKQLLNKKNWAGVKVGSVEEFQGLERRVIIISTVRSSADQLASDFYFKLGFLKNPKRFNVAITRSMALLIIVGNPFILSKDEHWGKMLRYCKENGGYTGCRFDDDDAVVGDGGTSVDAQETVYDNILTQLKQLDLNDQQALPGDLLAVAEIREKLIRFNEYIQ